MRLWRYVLSEHIGPFFFGLIVITFVLIIDFIPQVLDMVVGRDISAGVVARLFIYNLAWMLALSIPMAVLVAVLMAFGRLSADNEIVALKSSGVHLMRLITPVLLAAIVLGGLLVWFNNAVLPESNHAARVLMGNINRTRPTLRIQEVELKPPGDRRISPSSREFISIERSQICLDNPLKPLKV